MHFKHAILVAFFACFIHKSFAIPEYAPWGKDSEMNNCLPTGAKFQIGSNSQNMAGFESLIAFHKQVISQADGPRSHFIPSSSEYMRQACVKHGFFKGFTLGLDRLMRENSEPWVYPVYYTKDGDFLKKDPIP